MMMPHHSYSYLQEAANDAIRLARLDYYRFCHAYEYLFELIHDDDLWFEQCQNHVDEIQRWLSEQDYDGHFHGLYIIGFNNPDHAFAYKMRWC